MTLMNIKWAGMIQKPPSFKSKSAVLSANTYNGRRFVRCSLNDHDMSPGQARRISRWLSEAALWLDEELLPNVNKDFNEEHHV